MKRTALRRVTGLSRSTTRLRSRSRKMAKVYREARVPLVRRLLVERPACEAVNVAPGPCFGELTVHESIRRSQLGSIVQDAKAEAQGQTFHVLCVGHHGYVTDHPSWAVEHGFTQRRRAG